MIELQHVTCERGQKALFSGLNYKFEAGSFTVIRGANGCGKTTLLRAIVGMRPFASGQASAVAPENLVYLDHKNALYIEFTVREQLTLWARTFGVIETIAAAANYFGLDDSLDVRIDTLSAGWQRRVALAKLLLDPKRTIWVLDEPFANLDAEGKDTLTRLCAVRCDQGGLVILTAHEEVELPFGDVLQLDEVHA